LPRLAARFARRYRDGVTTLTLVGGFASTLSLPAVAWLPAEPGWRGALVAIGLVLLLVIAPLHAWALGGVEPLGPAVRRATAGVAEDATLREALSGRTF